MTDFYKGAISAMSSTNRVLLCMVFNNEGWIGFNVANDFLRLPQIPAF